MGHGEGDQAEYEAWQGLGLGRQRQLYEGADRVGGGVGEDEADVQVDQNQRAWLLWHLLGMRPAARRGMQGFE